MTGVITRSYTWFWIKLIIEYWEKCKRFRNNLEDCTAHEFSSVEKYERDDMYTTTSLPLVDLQLMNLKDSFQLQGIMKNYVLLLFVWLPQVRSTLICAPVAILGMMCPYLNTLILSSKCFRLHGTLSQVHWRRHWRQRGQDRQCFLMVDCPPLLKYNDSFKLQQFYSVGAGITLVAGTRLLLRMMWLIKTAVF